MSPCLHVQRRGWRGRDERWLGVRRALSSLSRVLLDLRAGYVGVGVWVLRRAGPSFYVIAVPHPLGDSARTGALPLCVFALACREAPPCRSRSACSYWRCLRGAPPVGVAVDLRTSDPRSGGGAHESHQCRSSERVKCWSFVGERRSPWVPTSSGANGDRCPYRSRALSLGVISFLGGWLVDEEFRLAPGLFFFWLGLCSR